MKVKACFSVLLIVLIIQQYAESARILGILPLAGKSVNMLYNKLMKGLADAGHDVTVVSPYENEFPILNGSYKSIVLTGFVEDYEKLLKDPALYAGTESVPLWESNIYIEMVLPIYQKTLNHTNVKRLLQSDAKFDLVITEYFFSDCLTIFAHIYQCPSIIFQSLGGVNPWIFELAGSPLLPSYIPHMFFLSGHKGGINFFQRVHNSLYFIFDHFYKHYVLYPAHDNLLQQHFQNPPKVSELRYNISLVLLGSHSSIRHATPLAPNMIDIGGFHIDPPKKLPEDLQDFFDGAQEGLIYFSMGSQLKSSMFSQEKKRILLNVFGRLKQKVLWKLEDDSLPDLPPNILIRKWLPQNDLLAHPNIKLFISHGGFGSSLETTYHGVPTLIIPVLLDQYTNANHAVREGYGLKLPYNDENFNEETLYSLIVEMLNNPKYTEQAKLRSRLLHDRQNKPLDTAIYWIEYIIRHKGAQHLQIAGKTLPWYQLYIVDVLLFLVATISLGLFVFYIFVKVILKKLIRRGESKIKSA